MGKMMNRIAARFGYAPARPARRSFTGAQLSRLTNTWTSTPLHINQELQRDLKILRARSRDLANNNDYGRKFLRMVANNVIGPEGFQLQVRAMRPDGTLDDSDSTRIENAFYEWGRPGNCEVTGQLSFCDVQRLVIQTVARDGEILIRRHKAGPFAFRLELIDPCALDEQYNDKAPNGNKVRMGVEVDQWGAPVAYWFNDYDLADPRGYYDASGQRRLRIPAEQVWHRFIPEAIGQVRGVPWMASAMLRLQMLGGYEEAAVVAARVGAAKMGVIETPDGDIVGMGNDVDASDNQIMDVEAGTFGSLPAGSKLTDWSPEYPHQQYGEFVKSCLRGISSGLGVAYNSLANDLEKVNYSSIRAGVIEERDAWRAIQGWMAESLLYPLYTEWLEMAILSGGLSLPMSRFDKFNAATWIGRRWEWVDPQKDIDAQVTAISHGLKSRRQVMAEQGVDLDETWKDLAAEQAKAETLGVKLADLTDAPAKPPPIKAVLEE